MKNNKQISISGSGLDYSFIIVLFVFFLCFSTGIGQIKTLKYGAFSFELSLTLPGSPEATYDAISGDISGWWDHSFSKKPYKLYLETKPGGGFYEIFDKNGDGALHATVIYAKRGKILRFTGPLGLSGNAIDLVNTYTFEKAAGDSTNLTLSVHAAGEMQEGWPEMVESVWRHFLFEQFSPYIKKLNKQ
jgi:hypothetical protein